MKLKISAFDINSINSAAEELEKYAKNVEKKAETLIRRLSEIGLNVAKVRFATAQYDGTNDVTVVIEGNGTSLKIVANGEAVAFIEFGTGVNNPPYNNAGLNFTPPARGGYGQRKGRNKKWGYYGDPGTNGIEIINGQGKKVVITKGNPPAEAMLSARNEILARVTEIAREVFKA